MLALAVQYFMHPLLLSIKRNSVAKQNSTDAYTTTPTCNITYMHVYSHVHTHTHTHTHKHTYTTMLMQDGFFPLSNASQEGHDRVVAMLLQAGATADLQNKVENCSCHLWCTMPCTVFNAQHSRTIKHIQQMTSTDMHGRKTHLCTGSMYIWWSVDKFPQKLDRECSGPWSEIKTPVNYILATRCAPVCKLGPLL